MWFFIGLVVGFIIGYYAGKKRNDSGNATGFNVKVDSPVTK